MVQIIGKSWTPWSRKDEKEKAWEKWLRKGMPRVAWPSAQKGTYVAKRHGKI